MAAWIVLYAEEPSFHRGRFEFFSKIRGDVRSSRSTGVVDTGGKFTAGVVDTGGGAP